MNISAKVAIVFLCAAICSLSVTLIPRTDRSPRPPNETTPVKLRDSARADLLLV